MGSPKKNAGESPVSKSVGDFYLLLKAIQKLCHDEHTGSLKAWPWVSCFKSTSSFPVYWPIDPLWTE